MYQMEGEKYKEKTSCYVLSHILYDKWCIAEADEHARLDAKWPELVKAIYKPNRKSDVETFSFLICQPISR